MKIAIIAPSPVPFTIGGVENLLWGMCTWMNQNTPHQVELLKLPSREFDFWSILETYRSFYHLDLSYFDMVISTKYPAWMVQHKNHVCYLQHRLRGLYDTYHFTKLPEETKRGNKKIDAILDYMDTHPDADSLDEFFAKMNALKKDSSGVPKEYFDFPAPFIRRVVHYMDDFALSRKRIKRHLCISNTVKKRLEYFPQGCPVTAIHHPSNLQQYSKGKYKHIFMVSRLDGPKRIDLLIQAMQYVKSDVKLFIAGTGPQEKILKELAGNDKRITFLGFVNDETVEEYYKNSLVIPYFPYDEDYGLITIEAMMHEKPVITTMDAGGPTEFVFNQETGFVVAAEPKSIGEKIEYFAEHPEEAARMGKNARRLVEKITWDMVVSGILGEPVQAKAKSAPSSEKRKKVVVTSTFPIYPPQGGGQSRTYHIYKNLAETFDVEIVSLTNDTNGRFCGSIAPGLVENRIGKSIRHSEEEWKIESKMKVPVTDVAMPLLIQYTPDYSKELEHAVSEAEIVVLSHPYMWTAAKPFLDGKRIVYEAQDVEYTIKKSILPDNRSAKELLDLTYQIEKECCEKSELILTCSEEDRQALSALYHVELSKILVVPNGVDTTKTNFIPLEERIGNKQGAGLSGEKTALFMGSWHGPNLEACERIFEIAEKCPEVKFLLMGSQCQYFKDWAIPQNVGMLGLVEEDAKQRVFSLVDFALNPMLSGSGTNLKMFDYMAAGIPIITTAFGTRGIDHKNAFIIAEVEEMPGAIEKFCLKEQKDRITEARAYAENTFDWSQIVRKFLDRLLN